MQVYDVPVSIENTDIETGFIFVDDNICDPAWTGYSSEHVYGFDTANEALDTLSAMFGSVLWCRAPQARYNRVSNLLMLEYVSSLFEDYWGNRVSFKPLGSVYTDDSTTLASSMLIDNVNYGANTTATGPENVYFPGGCFIGTNSPVNYAICLNNSTHGFFVECLVLPSSCIVSGKFNFTTQTQVARVRLCINNMQEPGEWWCQCYRAEYLTIPEGWVTALNGKDAEPADDDPWGNSGDPSGPGGGGATTGGDNWDNSDSNPIPGNPTLSAVDTGFITLYNPSAYELKTLANYLWGELFDLDQFKKIVADPMDTILGLNIVPVNVPSGGSQAVKVGNISTGVTLTKASSQYVTVNCGTINIAENWKGYLDYSPYTKISIFLPYIGDHELDIDVIQNTTLGVVYHVDILSGACVAFITANNRVVYQFAGQCAVSIPITSENFTQTLLSLGTLVAAGVGAVATGGLSAPVTAATIAGGTTAMANTAGNVASSKPRFAKSGNVSGGNGLMGSQSPYLMIQRPKPCVPASQNIYTGYPAYITYSLSSLSGFTQVQDIHLDDISCTETERNEILSKLREGVIL